ncbi:hypothetical protein K474DRAFT_702769 [Panus rudis PR-1116 ss-1]|nr:hypothetical protein K474DRAFT_702769 [Panus rudis PR-1116 ss-1]
MRIGRRSGVIVLHIPSDPQALLRSNCERWTCEDQCSPGLQHRGQFLCRPSVGEGDHCAEAVRRMYVDLIGEPAHLGWFACFVRHLVAFSEQMTRLVLELTVVVDNNHERTCDCSGSAAKRRLLSTGIFIVRYKRRHRSREETGDNSGERRKQR